MKPLGLDMHRNHRLKGKAAEALLHLIGVNANGRNYKQSGNTKHKYALRTHLQRFAYQKAGSNIKKKKKNKKKKGIIVQLHKMHCLYT